MQKILLIQTAFIGDVVLSTGILEKLHQFLPDARISILVRKGNETLFNGHPFLSEVLVWDKQKNKYTNLFRVLQQVRNRRFDRVINVQRFAATGLLTVLAGAETTVGFDKNPFSFLFSEVIRHEISEGDKWLHEIDRNQTLISSITDKKASRPRLYPTESDYQQVAQWKEEPYLCIAPASVWFTKQFPADQWAQFIRALPEGLNVYLLGARGDRMLCDAILQQSGRTCVWNLAGELGFLASAALQQDALMNYVNDSAPMHFASAVNAPVTALYCSTLPSFGFGPLSDNRHIIEVQERLSCRPCGLHGKKACPEQHFNCARMIQTSQLLATLPS
ncbi:MAG: glycosyltransferase family 9 protein [Bacteroidota bacterium]|nr:glycosyltransferase family 9 protein [Bacteroidota bacterium]